MLNVARLAFATAAIVAMTYQFATLNAAPGYAKGNFFSFFTIQSNILAIGALFALVLVPRARRTALFDGARGAVVLYIAITGVVFALLLAGLQEDLQTTIPWVDFVVHKLMPVVLVADWLIDPSRHKLPRWTVLAWLAYPLAWFTYTLVRGEIVDWYPLPVRRRVEARLRRGARALRRPLRRLRPRRRRAPLARQPARSLDGASRDGRSGRDDDLGDQLGREQPVLDDAHLGRESVGQRPRIVECSRVVGDDAAVRAPRDIP